MITQLDRSIYLASRSPRRRELLSQIGVRFQVLMFRDKPETDAELVRSVLLPGTRHSGFGDAPDREKTPVGGVATHDSIKDKLNQRQGVIWDGSAQAAGRLERLFLRVNFTATDAERRVSESREYLWDLDSARLVQHYSGLYRIDAELHRSLAAGEVP